MRNASMSLLSALAAKTPMWSADVFTLSLINGVNYYWTGADQSISYSGITYAAVGPAIERSSWSSKNTTEIANMEVQLYSNGADFGGNNIKADIIGGLFDGAYLLLQRAFMPTFGNTSLGLVTLFGGLVGEVEVTSTGAKITCSASNVQLEQNIPRRTYEAGCLHTLYDTGCTLNQASYSTGFTAASGGNALYLPWTVAPGTPSLLLYGIATITSGAGAGQSLTVTNYSSGGVAFSYPLLTVPAPGDSFSVSQGCDKSIPRCQAFGNILNYGGFPYVPPQSFGA
jgi:uncharacterized phage protein (TIGR02218 family)